MPTNEKLPSQASNYNTDEGFCNTWKHLSDLFESLEVREFKTLQGLVETTSTKKNLKRTMEAKQVSIRQKRKRITGISVFFISR